MRESLNLPDAAALRRIPGIMQDTINPGLDSCGSILRWRGPIGPPCARARPVCIGCNASSLDCQPARPFPELPVTLEQRSVGWKSFPYRRAYIAPMHEPGEVGVAADEPAPRRSNRIGPLKSHPYRAVSKPRPTWKAGTAR
jgi:hypothetical protein